LYELFTRKRAKKVKRWYRAIRTNSRIGQAFGLLWRSCVFGEV